MQKEELLLLIRDLADRQQAYAALITYALGFYRPCDPFILVMYDVQDRMYVEIRALLNELPGTDPEMLEQFDHLLQQHRLNTLLVRLNIQPSSPG